MTDKTNIPKVLIVEDEFILHQEYCTLLSKKELDVSLAYSSNYEEAIKNIDAFQPDVVLLDIELQGIKTGIDIAEHLNERHVPFIFLTGHHSKIILSQAQKVKPAAFIPKASVSQDLLYANILMALKDEVTSVKTLKGVALPKGQKIDYYDFDKIVYIVSENKEKKNHICYYVESDGKLEPYLIRDSIVSVAKSLPSNFVQINKGCIVNMDKINGRKSYNGTLYIGEYPLSIGDSFKQSVMKELADRYGI